MWLVIDPAMNWNVPPSQSHRDDGVVSMITNPADASDADVIHPRMCTCSSGYHPVRKERTFGRHL
jgi:hypothetical protein